MNFVERNQLDRLLKQSLDLSTNQENSVALYNHVNDQINKIKASLLESYSKQEIELLSSLSKQPNNEKLSNDLVRLREKKKNVQHINREMPHGKSTDTSLQIEKEDMPKDIEAKATLFRDREATFRQKAEELEKRYKKAKAETTLRNRMAEMVDDVRLFDSRDEAISQSGPNRTAETQEAKFFDDTREAWNNPEYMGGISNSLTVFDANQLLSLYFQTMPTYDVQEYLTGLEKQKATLLREADSLSVLADAFENEAEKLRSSLKNSSQ